MRSIGCFVDPVGLKPHARSSDARLTGAGGPSCDRELREHAVARRPSGLFRDRRRGRAGEHNLRGQPLRDRILLCNLRKLVQCRECGAGPSSRASWGEFGAGETVRELQRCRGLRGWLEDSLFGTWQDLLTSDIDSDRGATTVSNCSLGFSTGGNPSAAEGSA